MDRKIARWWANRPLATKGLVVVAVPLLIFLARLIHDGPAVGYSAPALPLGA